MQRLLQRLIHERLVAGVIIVNTIAVFLRAFPSLRDLDSKLFYVDYACTVFFVLELVAKVRLFGWRKYLSTGWNRFDLTVVALSLPMLVSPVVDTSDFSIFLVFRVARPLRAFRLLRFVPEGKRLWSGIKQALKASVGVGMALAMYNFVLALVACYLFGEAAPEYFEDPFISIYSMFKVFTVEGWYDVPDAIAQGSSAALGVFARLYFVFAVMTGGLLGLTMANGVFIDEMAIDNNKELEKDVKELKREIGELRRQNAEALRALQRAVESLVPKK